MTIVLDMMNVQNKPSEKHGFIKDLFGKRHSYVKLSPAKEQDMAINNEKDNSDKK